MVKRFVCPIYFERKDNQHMHENKDTIRDFKPKSKEQELVDKEIFLVQKEKNQKQRKKEGNRKKQRRITLKFLVVQGENSKLLERVIFKYARKKHRADIEVYNNFCFLKFCFENGNPIGIPSDAYFTKIGRSRNEHDYEVHGQ